MSKIMRSDPQYLCDTHAGARYSTCYLLCLQSPPQNYTESLVWGVHYRVFETVPREVLEDMEYMVIHQMSVIDDNYQTEQQGLDFSKMPQKE